MAQARLDVKVTGDASGALKAIQAVRAAGNEAATKFREQSKEAVGGLVRLVNPITIASTALIAGFAKATQAIKDHFAEGREAVKKAGEELTKASQAVGVTTEAYQALQVAAERAGVGVEAFNAALERVKEGKQTVTELLDAWREMPEAVALSTDTIQRFQLQAAAKRQERERAEEEREANLSAATDADRFVGEAQARILAGEDYADVVRELIGKYGRRKWYTTGFTTNEDELLDAVHELGLWRRSLELQEERDYLAQVDAKNAAREAEAEAASQARARREQADAAERRAQWAQVQAAGGVDAWVAGQLIANGKADVGATQEQLAATEGYEALRRAALALREEFDPNANDGVVLRAKTWTQAMKDAEAETKARAEAERKAAEAVKKATEERRKLAAEAEKDAKAREELWAWYKDARIEAAQSYAGGYVNQFGLAFGGGDLIGSGRFRAVTRMTEAQKQLQVSEKLLEVNRQMNEKLKALEE